ncbi:sensor histidine kinase [Exiguobacterium artemiae]|uniref:sensor histidine kinase n=1 Tax=Exiguobacterium artemiae TaxID=340145 RepID=UPI002965200F|nr:HAMP domain-containing sensor histidine kinase [Exiguobacterium sibiricum]MDW2884675.1 HAMP domain-containing sensor histidine kinase [Exiguobacterium sibiricum]
MSVLKSFASSLLSRVLALNTLLLVLTVFIAGLSLTQYACYVVTEQHLSGTSLNSKLYTFFFYISFALISFGIFLHFLSLRRLLRPIRFLSQSVLQFKERRKIVSIPGSASQDIQLLSHNFRDMMLTIKEAEQTQEEFLRDLAHELRTPLTNLNGYLEALKQGTVLGTPDLYASLLEESQRMTRLLNQLNELEHWERSSSHIISNSVSMARLLSETLLHYELPLQQIFQDIAVSIEDAELSIDRDAVFQIFANVIQNILDYNTGSTFQITGKKTDLSYQLIFSHTGQYIAPEEKERIFERFYRCDTSRTLRTTGAGLGLAITRRILHSQHATIQLETDGYQHHFQIEWLFSS